MFEHMIHWCEYHDYKWKIIDNYFYWQTNYQTGRYDQNNNLTWGSYEWFTEV